MTQNIIIADPAGDDLTGTSGDDRFEGGAGDDVFWGLEGDDTYLGRGGYNQVNFYGAAADYSISQNVSGSVRIGHAVWGVDDLYDIGGVYFEGEGQWCDIDYLLDQYGGSGDEDVNVITADPAGDDLTGTSGDDRFEGGAGDDVFRGFEGDDVYLGRGGYNQVDFAGAAADYSISETADGSVIIAHTTWGGDTLYDIGGVYFEGEGQWYSMNDLLDQYGGGGSDGGTSGDGSSPFDTADYGYALSLSMQFYYAQYSGDLTNDFDGEFPIAWRGDSALNDGKWDAQGNYDPSSTLDLSGGWYDAGDHVKFGLPMAYSVTTLASGAIDYKASYVASGSYDDIKQHLEWVTDYFLRCYDDKGTAALSDDVFYAQIGDGYADHSYWGAPEDMTMARPAYAVTAAAPGTEVTAETAAAMAASSIVFREDGETAYADELLANAIKLYDFSEAFKENGSYNDSIPDIMSFYGSYSGYNDELSWAANWLYEATGEAQYLQDAESYYSGQTTSLFSWENKFMGVAARLAKHTEDKTYFDDLNAHLTWANSEIRLAGTETNDGMLHLDYWGPARFAANTSYIAVQYADALTGRNQAGDDAKAKNLYNFASDQIDYMLGDNPNGQSYVVGFGDDDPLNPHHRAASGTTNINDLDPNEHILYGALVGGPDENGNYNDVRSDYVSNEVAVDYNAAYSGVLAALMKGEGAGGSATDKPDIVKPETTVNGSFATAVNLDGNFDLVDNPNIEAATEIPHATVVAEAADGVTEYYTFSAEAGARGIFDIDDANFDTFIYLYDSSGNLLASNDDSDSDPGSTSYTSLIDFVFSEDGDYYLGVGEYGGDGMLDDGQVYTLHTSIEGATMDYLI